VLDSQPSTDFKFDSAKNRLVNLQLGVDDAPNIVFAVPGDEVVGDAMRGEHGGGTGRQGRLMRLEGWIELDSWLTVNIKGPFELCSTNE